VLGFTVNVGSFADNLLASAADIIVGIFIAFYLVDYVSRREKSRKWDRVKTLTYKSIESVCERIMFALITETRSSAKSAPYAQGQPEHPWYENFYKLSEAISNNINELTHVDTIVIDHKIRKAHLPSEILVAHSQHGVTVASNEAFAKQLHDEALHRASSQYLLLEVTPHIEKLSLNILPRILELGEQEDLVSSFIDVESAFQDWETNVEMIEGDWGMPEDFAWQAVAQFCAQMGEMLKIVYLDQRQGAT